MRAVKIPESDLAAKGGAPVRKAPFPVRGLVGEEEKRAVVELMDRSARTGEPIGYRGAEQEAFEKEAARWLGGGHVAAVTSGTTALLSALGGLGLEPWSEVIAPPITDPGGIMPILFLGCVPVVADAAPGSFNAGADGVERVVTDRTRAIVVAHIGGEPADMDPILGVAERRGLPVIEDCAQAPGALYRGRLVGTMGKAAVFSTMFGKHFCTGPQGGFVFTRDEDLFWRTRRFSDRGKPLNLDAKTNVSLGLNLNSNDLFAAIGRVQLGKLPGMLERRRAVARAIAEGAAGLEGLEVATGPPGSEPSYWWIRIVLDPARFRVPKAAFADAVAAEGIPVIASYRNLPSEAEWFMEKATFGKSGYPWNSPLYEGERSPRPDCANAVAAVETSFCVVIHEGCGDAEARDIVAALAKVWGAYAR